MNIAVINDNQLISKLIDIALKEKLHIVENIDFKSHLDKIFDLIIVDEDMYSEDILVKFSNAKIVLLSSQNRMDDFLSIDAIWQVLKKPFMPDQLSELVAKLDNSETLTTNKEIPDTAIQIQEKLAEPINNNPAVQILDSETIEEIQGLLEDNICKNECHEKNTESSTLEYELSENDKSINIQKANEKNKKRLLRKIFDRSSTQNNKSDKILDALLSMKHKKLKKLLKNSEINITIKFTKDKK